MIKTVMLCGEEFEENGKYYFKNVDDVINDFLEENNVEYVDLKIISQEHYEVILVYKTKEDK